MPNNGWMPSAGIMQPTLGGFADMGKRFKDQGNMQGLKDNMMPALQTQNTNMPFMQAGFGGGFMGQNVSPAASGFSGPMMQKLNMPKFGGGL